MILAYDEIMKTVSLAGAQMPGSMTVARLIVVLATQGERDPDRLCNSVLGLLNADDQAHSIDRQKTPHRERSSGQC
jgi:hypothetical protein